DEQGRTEPAEQGVGGSGPPSSPTWEHGGTLLRCRARGDSGRAEEPLRKGLVVARLGSKHLELVLGDRLEELRRNRPAGLSRREIQIELRWPFRTRHLLDGDVVPDDVDGP